MRQLSTPTFMGSKMGFDRALSKNHFSPPNQHQVLPPNGGHMDDMNRGRGGFRNGFNGPNRGFNDRRPHNGRYSSCIAVYSGELIFSLASVVMSTQALFFFFLHLIV